MIQVIPTENAMLDFGAKMSEGCTKPAILFLYGDLGAGKTTLVRGFLRGLGYKGAVKSPTYTIVEPYQFEQVSIFHFDLYRVHHPEELEFIGIQDYFNQDAICLIEWPENGGNWLPPPDLSCYIEPYNGGRKLKLLPQSASGEGIIKRLQDEK